MALPGTPSLRWQASQSTVSIGSVVTSVPDSSGNGYNGTVLGSPTLVSGYNGLPAYHTNGSSSALVGSSTVAQLLSGPAAAPNGWTVAVVFLQDSSLTGVNVLSANESSTTNNLFRTQCNSSRQVSNLVDSASGNYCQTVASSSTTTSSTVPTIAISVSTSTAGSYTYQQLNLFLNGTKFIGSQTTNKPSSGTFNQFYVGTGPAPATPTTLSYFAGQFYDVIVWPTALSDTDVASANSYLQSLYQNVPDNATIQAITKRPTASGSITENSPLIIQAFTKKPFALGNGQFSENMAGSAVTKRPSAQSFLQITDRSSAATVTKRPIASGIGNSSIAAMIASYTSTPKASGNGGIIEKLSLNGVTKRSTASGSIQLAHSEDQRMFLSF